MDSKRNKILRLLKQHDILSGETIAQSLGISRPAVWKHIQILQKKGYKIASLRQKGYKLLALPEIPVEEIKARLGSESLWNTMQCFSELPSTNEHLKELTKKNLPEGVVIIAETQSKGKGRKQRQWISTEGGLYFSVLLRPPLPPQKAMLATMATSIAMAKAIRETTGIQVRIKWPNDLLYEGKKICGVLTELSAEMDQITYMIIGVGINVNNMIPVELCSFATTLQAIGGKKISLADLLTSCLSNLDIWYDHVKKGKQKLIFNTWLEYTDTIGKTVQIRDATSTITGLAKGITENGGLILETKEGTKQIVSGDISYINL
jgi:BirA family transcriptional regulator, biotin operon repressor / biotin---[acetyl-CoA-carboxylase] ligase